MTRWSRSRSMIAVVLAAFMATATTVAHAEVVQTPPGAVSTVQASIAIDNDWQFMDSECLLIPLLVTYGRADDTSILGELTVTKPAAPDLANEGTFLVLPGDPVSGQLLDEVFVCPADGTGEYRLSTIIRAIEPTAEQSFNLDPLIFWVRPAVSTMADVTARSIKGGTSVSGTVRAGESAATGFVEVRYRVPGKQRWSAPTIVPVEEGNFSTVVPRTLPANTRIKATLTGCSWCSRVSDIVRVR